MKYYYHTFPAFVDAYQQSFERAKSIEDIKDIAISNVCSFEHLINKDNLPRYLDKFIIGGIYTYSEDLEKNSAFYILSDGLSFDYEIVEIGLENNLSLIDVT